VRAMPPANIRLICRRHCGATIGAAVSLALLLGTRRKFTGNSA
jgi:hypothetical protein